MQRLIIVHVIILLIAVGLPFHACIALAASSNAAATPCKYPAVFVFGDSLLDTGNCYLTGQQLCQVVGQYPYGITFPGKPFFRFGDGKVLTDYLASYVGLPDFLQPYLNFSSTSANYTYGVNYAVAASTAVDAVTLLAQGMVPLNVWSLDVQIAWHVGLKTTVDLASAVGITLPRQPLASEFSKALYIVAIGANDYNAALAANKTSDYVNNTLIPQVMQKIKEATERLYATGARHFLYIGIPAVGCLPAVLSAGAATATQDSYGCLVEFNTVSQTHSSKLLELTQNLSATYPSADFTFADSHSAYLYIVRNKATFGFSDALDACCGAGPSFPYNYNNQMPCSNSSSTYVCPNPNKYISWDGLHATNAFQSQMLNQTFISGAFLIPSNGLKTRCPV